MAPSQGQTVRVHYRGTLADGTEFDSSRGREPLEFQLGSQQVIPGFEAAVITLEPGETLTVTIPAEDAYGERHPEAVQQVPRTMFTEEPEVGCMVSLVAPDATELAAEIAEVGEDEVTLDFNHPLAGQALTFEIELVDAQD